MRFITSLSIVLALLVPMTAHATIYLYVDSQSAYDDFEDAIQDEIEDVVDDVERNVQTGRTKTVDSVLSTEKDLLDEIEDTIDESIDISHARFIPDLKDLERDLKREVRDDFDRILSQLGYSRNTSQNTFNFGTPYTNAYSSGSQYQPQGYFQPFDYNSFFASPFGYSFPSFGYGFGGYGGYGFF